MRLTHERNFITGIAEHVGNQREGIRHLRVTVVDCSGSVRVHSAEIEARERQAERIHTKAVPKDDALSSDAVNVRCVQNFVASKRRLIPADASPRKKTRLGLSPLAGSAVSVPELRPHDSHASCYCHPAHEIPTRLVRSGFVHSINLRCILRARTDQPLNIRK